MKKTPETTIDALYEVIDATRSLMHRMKAAAEELHADDDLTAGMRGVLLSLADHGPKTVPELARMRPVTRQHIQALVNPLADAGLVGFAENPAHRRSHLVRLTPLGKRRVERLLRREREVFRKLGVDVPAATLRDAAATLDRVRGLFTSRAWGRIVTKGGRT